MRAKFYCESVKDFGKRKEAVLNAVTNSNDNEENQDFSKYTPDGHLRILIDKDGAMNYFEPEKEYYLDFTLAD